MAVSNTPCSSTPKELATGELPMTLSTTQWSMPASSNSHLLKGWYSYPYAPLRRGRKSLWNMDQATGQTDTISHSQLQYRLSNATTSPNCHPTHPPLSSLPPHPPQGVKSAQHSPSSTHLPPPPPSSDLLPPPNPLPQLSVSASLLVEPLETL